MRTKKSFLNVLSNSLIFIIRSILLFVVRIVFVKTLGKTLLGVDSLFTNLLLIFSIADSGISTAINFSLYKPLADKDYEKVSSLMTFYKKMYRILGTVILLLGIILVPFLRFIIRENINNLYLYYFIYLATTVLSYFISYKDSLLTADQNLYKSSIIVGSTYILMYIFRIAFLFIIPNFLIYTLIQLIFMFIQRLLVNRYITKTYTHISFSSQTEISKKEQKKIFKNIKAMFLNKFGNFMINGTDNIIISALPKLGLGVVAVYTNYYSIISTVSNIISRGLSGVTSSFGDLSVNESKKVQEDVFNIIAFISFCIYGLFVVGFIFLLSPFIKICFGLSYELSTELTIIICLNFYILGMLTNLDVIKEATGNYVQDRYANLIQAAINVILSIVLGKMLGLLGVVLATLISYILVPLWNKPYITYKYVFEKKAYSYFLQQAKYLLSLVLICFISKYLVSFLHIDNLLLDFLIKTITISIIYFVLIIIIYSRKSEFKYVANKIKKIVIKS